MDSIDLSQRVQLVGEQKGLKIPRSFTKEGENVYGTVEWEKRTSMIKNPDGTVVFKMENVEIPKSWSQTALDILAQKYFRKRGVPQFDADGNPILDANGQQVIGCETSLKQVVHRLAGCWMWWGKKYNYFASEEDSKVFYDEIAYMLLHQIVAPNSPQWFNTGLNFAYGIGGPSQGHWYVDPDTRILSQSQDAYSHPQCHACFIQPVRDDLVNEGGILDLAVREARIFKYGSGTGTNFSNLRAKGETLSGGGTSSGLLSFLKIYDTVAGSIKSGGTTRRAAKMVILNVDHPEIEDFIRWKADEEKKFAALMGAGLVNSNNVEAAGESVFGQNSNNSVRVTDDYMASVMDEKDWNLIRRTDGKVAKTVKASYLWDLVAQAAWECADPGLQFDTTINDWHTCPASGRINASNPCVTGDTKILVKDGKWVRIDKLVDMETEILTNTGFIQNSVIGGSFVTGEKPVYKLVTESGYELKLTADHKVFTVNRGFVPAMELTKDDYVLLPVNCVDKIDELDGNEKRFYQLLGIILGDGHYDGHYIQITMNKNENLILQKFAEYSSDFEKITHKNYQTRILMTPTSSKLNLVSKQLVNEVSRFMQPTLSYERYVSDAIFELPLGMQKYVLQGLFTADGTVANYGEKSQYVSLDSTSLHLLKDVQVLLLGFGIKSKIYRNRRAGKDVALLPDGKGGLKEYKVNEMHSLRISKSSRILFEKMIGFMPESGKSELLKVVNETVSAYKDLPFDAVESLEYLGVEKVYDLTEPLTHTFVANGMTIHNCSEYMFLDNTACNLASLNLGKFLNGSFNIESFKHAVRLWTIVLELSVLMAQYPSKEIAQLSYEYRTLGLGYTNLGSMLMRMGIPYDSDKARAISAAISGIMTGESYAASAEIASVLGAFEGFEKNKEHMLRVIRNHRRIVYNARKEEYENLHVIPPGIDNTKCPEDLLKSAIESWDRALLLGERYGYRNAQTTLIAPTGTISFVMDADTTGVEPDFALVKFKKLVGGGYFKIINQSVASALRNIGYTEDQIKDILKYVLGSNTFEGAPYVNTFTLKRKGFTDSELDKMEKLLSGSMDLTFVFNLVTLGKECLERLGIKESQYTSPDFNLLKALGFRDDEIEAANEYICGTQTIEGAPHLKTEHYAIFDCANKCGKKGVRYIDYMAHVKMMAAVQPLLSGSISKTINMPSHATVDDIKQVYLESWKLALKSVALYRDGSKAIQPLSVFREKKEELKPQRRKLEAERNAIAHKFRVGNQEGYIHVGLFEDGSPGELFVTMAKQGSTLSGLMDAFALTISIGLQYGVPLKVWVSKFINNRFEPMGWTDNPDIPIAKSITDYIFRWMAFKFLPKEDLKELGMLNGEHVIVSGEKPEEIESQNREVASLSLFTKEGKRNYDADGDAPTCHECGNVMVRSGTCYVCTGCGTTSGCS
ncbi:MAG: vitamin B12-dependent ribonucleotide reductase [Candidatus Aenigmarchaeota archaeon]|nr:vitamin B12-dependent ribonucleotide reductase [Candidatus Aenigmarchaeota archaeon]